jgi:hypothetical protein
MADSRTSSGQWRRNVLDPISRRQGCFVSSFFRIRRSSIKFSAVIVQSTLPNMIITISIEAGSSPAWLLRLPFRLWANFSKGI